MNRKFRKTSLSKNISKEAVNAINELMEVRYDLQLVFQRFAELLRTVEDSISDANAEEYALNLNDFFERAGHEIFEPLTVDILTFMSDK